RPGVLLAPEGPGRGELVMSFARKLAEAGYVAFAMDYHGEGEVLTEFEELMKRIGGFMADPAGIRAIAAEALSVLVGRPETDASRIAAIGYCFGGTTVLELPRPGPAGSWVAAFTPAWPPPRRRAAGTTRGRVRVRLGNKNRR